MRLVRRNMYKDLRVREHRVDVKLGQKVAVVRATGKELMKRARELSTWTRKNILFPIPSLIIFSL